MDHKPNREMTDLRASLRLEQTRAGAVARILEVYKRTGSLGETATELGVSRKTLERIRSDYPEVGNEINKLRNARSVFSGP